MTPEAEQRAADILLAARRDGRALTGLDEDVRPTTMADGYRIQNRLRAAWCAATGDRVSGWKVGATAAAVQEKFGVTAPFGGPFFSSTVFASPARLTASDFQHRAIESEFAFRFDKPLLPRAAAYARAEVVAAVDAVVPAIEIVSPRFNDLLFGRAPIAVADCALNGGFVFGAPVTNWRAFALPEHPVTLRVNGAVAAEGNGSAVLGDPVTALVWAVNHLSSQNIAVEAGQIISTGTTTGIVHLVAGDTGVADFGPLGTVEVRFA